MPSSLGQRLALASYRLIVNLMVPLAGLVALPFLFLSIKRRKTLFQRLGWQTYPPDLQAQARPVWVHALSVGETLSAVNLIKQISGQLHDRPLYLSVSTLSGYAIAREKLGQEVDGLFYFPYDLEISIRTCLNRIRPVLFILIETDIWPGFLAQLRCRRIPCFLLNARLSPQSFSLYSNLLPLFQPAFNTFHWVYPQSEREAARFLALGVHPAKIRRCANLKLDTTELLPSEQTIHELKNSLNLKGGSPIFVAGSTHSGEEVIVRSVFLRLQEHYPDLALILVPRHPDRAKELVALFQQDPLNVTLFSRVNHRHPSVVVVDQMGFLSRLYALADVAFVGGSLVPQGGHNPIEPACWGKPVLFGPDMRDFPDISKWLLESGGAIQVQDGEGLFEQTLKLLENREMGRTMGSQGRGLVERHRGTTRAIVQDIIQFLGASETPPHTEV